MNVIQELQSWYDSQCNEDWEHSYGVFVETLDNPGWDVKVDLYYTDLQDVPFEPVIDIKPKREWMRCEVKDYQFVGCGGPNQLERIIRTFLDWAKKHEAV